VAFVRYADDVRLLSRTPAGARKALKRTEEELSELGLRLNASTTRLVSVHQGVDFLGYRLVAVKGHLNAYINPKVIERFRDEVRRLTRRTAGVSFPVMMARLNEYLRGWAEYFKRAQASGVFDSARSVDSTSGASL
jgi:RNA-directed DNA polymerase